MSEVFFQGDSGSWYRLSAFVSYSVWEQHVYDGGLEYAIGGKLPDKQEWGLARSFKTEEEAKSALDRLMRLANKQRTISYKEWTKPPEPEVVVEPRKLDRREPRPVPEFS